jgi:lipopolysaccharide/colanic/teichoic acid biosynthesis glycosyltransferase
MLVKNNALNSKKTREYPQIGIHYYILSPGRNNKISFVFKRVFDLFLSFILLLASFPFFCIIGLLIKIESEGNVIFKQIRIGRNRRNNQIPDDFKSKEKRKQNLKGNPFYIYKFRTMYKETPVYSRTPETYDDQRITVVGKFLRKYCLDELPQLVNVLKGEMSLVGPRPEMPFIVKSYEDRHCIRLNASPGITGIWQLYGSRNKAIHEELEYDNYYIQNWSLWLDLKLLVNTIMFVLQARNY